MTDQPEFAEAQVNGALVPAPRPVEISVRELRGPALAGTEPAAVAVSAPDGAELLGQDRAIAAVRMAIDIGAPGYNVYVSGLRTQGERERLMRLLEEKAEKMPTPGDWIYLNNFHNPESPVAAYLKPGQGRELRQHMRELVNYVRDRLPNAFRQQDFDQERASLKEKYNKRAQELFGSFETRARERGFAIQGGPGGQLLFIPLIGGKMPESPEALNRAMGEMAPEERERLGKIQSELQDELGTLLMRQQEMMRELVNEIHTIERAFASRLITPAAGELARRFGHPIISTYLEQVADHMLNHLDWFREPRGGPERRENEGPPVATNPAETAHPVEYQVNLLVDNGGKTGAPVVFEDAPSYRNLFGTIERWVDPMGRIGTNFTRIVSGSFLKAHGGFLVFDLEDAVVEPGVWRTLKRALKTGRMTLETFEPYSFFSVSGLKPEPIEIRNKMVIFGGGYLYNLLYFYDQDFAELFKVKAELRPVVEANNNALASYAARVDSLAKGENLPSFDGPAIARIVEYGMRLAGDRTRVVSRMEPIDDLVREAAYFARIEHAAAVGARHIERALNERILRLNFIEEEIRRLIANGTLIVHLEGSRVGQINGLAVLDVGGYAFGKPSRVTATVALGQAGVINIERESRLSGSTHDKGIMILSGFLRSRFGQKHPVAMAASICFEQSYSGIDGDSASSTELYALLSALSDVPLRQDLAVTGSVDQHGTVQAIGGANEKIESFYRVCKAVGVTGTQGVMIPRANLRNLLLEPEVLDAVERGMFHIYAVDNIDQGIEILTGVKAGALDEPGTINYLVDQRLRKMAQLLRGAITHETRIIQEVAPSAPPRPPIPPEPPR